MVEHFALILDAVALHHSVVRVGQANVLRRAVGLFRHFYALLVIQTFQKSEYQGGAGLPITLFRQQFSAAVLESRVCRLVV
jgi:hypothetical protein